MMQKSAVRLSPYAMWHECVRALLRAFVSPIWRAKSVISRNGVIGSSPDGNHRPS
jgi:hypothetical protein